MIGEIGMHGHPVTWSYQCYDFYGPVPADEQWNDCIECGQCPMIWTFDNGRCTACHCGRHEVDHWSIHAESIMSVYSRTKSAIAYESDALRLHWNHWCDTGEVLFDKPQGGRKDGRW